MKVLSFVFDFGRSLYKKYNTGRENVEQLNKRTESEKIMKEVNMKTNIDIINLTDDPLKNILIMAPLLDEAGQNRVFGLMCGLIAGNSAVTEKGKQTGTTMG